MWEVKVKPEMYVSTFKLELVKAADDKTQWNRLRNCTEDYTISEELSLHPNKQLSFTDNCLPYKSINCLGICATAPETKADPKHLIHFPGFQALAWICYGSAHIVGENFSIISSRLLNSMNIMIYVYPALTKASLLPQEFIRWAKYDIQE